MIRPSASPHDVFISYSSHDKPIADAVCATVEGKRIRCWIAPRDVQAGIPYAEQLTDAIEGCRLLVLVLSSNSNNSDQVAREVEAAVSKGLPIVPVRIEDVELSKSMRYFLKSIHWLDAITPPIERHLNLVAETVGLLLSRMASDEVSVAQTGVAEIEGAKGREQTAAPHREKGWAFFALGLVSVIVGMMAVGATFLATLASVTVFGALLFVAGITEVIHAVMVRNLSGFALHLLSAVLYLIVGLFMLEDPVRAAAVLTLLLSASFLVGGLLRVVFSLVVRFPSWPWVLVNGVVDLILGVLIWREWPESSLWVIGLFVGIELLFHGWSSIILALTVRPYNAPQSA